MTDIDHLAEVAAELVARVRDDDPDANGRWLASVLDPQDWLRLPFVLAAAVPCPEGGRPDWLRLTSWANPKPDPHHVDEIAVERACRGERIELTLAERRVAIAKLDRRGMSQKAIARLLGVAPRTVGRHRAARREESA